MYVIYNNEILTIFKRREVQNSYNFVVNEPFIDLSLSNMQTKFF